MRTASKMKCYNDGGSRTIHQHYIDKNNKNDNRWCWHVLPTTLRENARIKHETETIRLHETMKF